MDQCSILYVKTGPGAAVHAVELRALGFSVDVEDDLPPADVFTRYHAVVVRVRPESNLPVLGMRLRAKPRFGRRVLIALLPDSFSPRECRDATASGFDVVLPRDCCPRDLAAHILRRLRAYPEFRCLLRAPHGRRKAA